MRFYDVVEFIHAVQATESTMNIFNRPPAIAEDSLQFFIHLGPLSSNRYDALALATYFRSHASNTLPGHMWHRDSFELNVSIDEKGRYNLDGIMRVGDSVDDEWCAVWLLKDISRHWDVAVRCVFECLCDYSIEYALKQDV